MTETTGTIVYLPPEHHDPAGNQRMRSAGLPLPGVELCILEKAGNALGPNSVGENVCPAEVESAVYGHPAVAEVAVIGVPDDKWGKAVKAIVVPRQGASIDAADIIAFAQQHIAAFKVPKSVDVIDALPRNASGKVLRRTLREQYWRGTPAA